jgi:hypothetical protein
LENNVISRGGRKTHTLEIGGHVQMAKRSCYNAFTPQKYYGFQKPILLNKIALSYLQPLSIAFS